MLGYPPEKPLRDLTPAEMARHPDQQACLRSSSKRKYSLGWLEEAYKLSKELGITKAAKLSGVSYETLTKHVLVRKLREGYVPKPGRFKVSPEQKQKCWEIAMQLYGRYSHSTRKCWIEAGRRLGVCGRTVETQFTRGTWKPKVS